jgi:hypothetical protein
MGANSFVENTPNASKFICPICLPKPKKIWILIEKGFFGQT